MTNFRERSAQSEEFVQLFTEEFNRACRTHRIVKFGIENTRMHELHQYIRSAEDAASQFVRYLPDATLVHTGAGQGPRTALIEFKVQSMLVQQDSFFQRIQDDHGDRSPALTAKQDVFDMENAALVVYRQIAGMEVPVVVVALQRPRLHSDPGTAIRAQFAERIVVSQVHDPSGRGAGSHTTIANTHFGSFDPVGDFFGTHFGIATSVFDNVIARTQADLA